MRSYKNNEVCVSSPWIERRYAKNPCVTNARMNLRSNGLHQSHNTSTIILPRSTSSVTLGCLSRGSQLVHPSTDRGSHRLVQSHPARGQHPPPVQRECPSVKVYAQPEMSQLTQDTSSFSGDSPGDLAQCSGPPAHQNSSQSQSTFASSWRGGISSFQCSSFNSSPQRQRLSSRGALHAPIAALHHSVVAPMGVSHLPTKSLPSVRPGSGGGTIFRRTTPGVVGGSSVTEGLRAPSAQPPSSSVIKRGSAAFEKSLQEFHSNKAKEAIQEQESASVVGTVGSLYSEKNHNEFKQAMLEELTSVLESKVKKNLDEAVASFKAAMEASDNARDEKVSRKIADLEIRAEATRNDTSSQIHDQLMNKFLDVDATLEDHIATKFASIDDRMNKLKLSSKEEVHEMIEERTEEFLTMAAVAEDALQDQRESCAKEIRDGIESIRIESKTQFDVLRDAVKSHLAAINEVAGPVMEACHRWRHEMVVAPAKVVIDSLVSGTKPRDIDQPPTHKDATLSSDYSMARQRTISPVPCKRKKRAPPADGPEKTQTKRSKSSQISSPKPTEADNETDSSWSSTGASNPKGSRPSSGYEPLNLRTGPNALQTPATSTNSVALYADGGEPQDQFLLSQGTLSSISCTQTAKTGDLPVKSKISASIKNGDRKPFVSPTGPTQGTKKKISVDVPLIASTHKETPPQRPKRRSTTNTQSCPNTSMSASEIKFVTPLAQTKYDPAPVSEIRTAMDEGCPSPLTTNSFIRANEKAARRDKKTRAVGLIPKNSNRQTHGGPPKKETTTNSGRMAITRRSRRKSSYSKRSVGKDAAMINTDLDFMSHC